MIDSTCVSQLPIRDPEELRREMEQQLEAWQKQPPGAPEEVLHSHTGPAARMRAELLHMLHTPYMCSSS